MDLEYHIEITRSALKDYFNDVTLQEIISANLSQDSIFRQLGSRARFHFDNNLLVEGLSYIETEYKKIGMLASNKNGGTEQRVSFGRICHAVQDFYSHSNYVALWLNANGGVEQSLPEQIDALDISLLNHPNLHTGYFILWRDFFYLIPIIKHIVRRIYIPPDSHEAMNLDSPSRGLKFHYAVMAAIQRTDYEYHRAEEAILKKGGQEALRRFQGA